MEAQRRDRETVVASWPVVAVQPRNQERQARMRRQEASQAAAVAAGDRFEEAIQRLDRRSRPAAPRAHLAPACQEGRESQAAP